jgi:WhiB family redox-sensing transcriptional regulator
MSDWRERAACRGAEALFFHPEHERGWAAYQRIVKAKAVCARCPVKPECLAEYWWEPFGVFGGMTAAERQKTRSGERMRAAS